MMQKDKLLHFIVGVAIALSGLFIRLNPKMVLGLVAFAGLGKEIRDYFHPKGCADFYDALATFLGGLAVILLIKSIL
jgi:hypothetical protein